jgi:hypothetical protein
LREFRTTVFDEIGHAQWLGGGGDPSSPLNEILAAGTAARAVTVADLNIPKTPAGADQQSGTMAAHVMPAAAAAAPTLNQNVALMAWDLAVSDMDQTVILFGRTQHKRT